MVVMTIHAEPIQSEQERVARADGRLARRRFRFDSGQEET